MIYGNNVKLETVTDNRQVKCKLLLQENSAAESREVSAGLNYWQFMNAAVTVMRKHDYSYDLFFFPCRDVEQPLTCGPRDVFEFRVFDCDFVYHLTDGWFWLNHQPGKKKLKTGEEVFWGDLYLGKTILAGDVFGEKLENGSWNVTAMSEQTDEFETVRYAAYTASSDRMFGFGQRFDGRFDLFSGRYRIETGNDGDYLKIQVNEGVALFFADGNGWKLVYYGTDCLPEKFIVPAVLLYDVDAKRTGTLIVFDENRRHEEHGEIEFFDQNMIAVDDKVFDSYRLETFFAD